MKTNHEKTWLCRAERILRISSITRAVIGAALVVLCAVGAVWFPTHSVVGQETKPTTLHGTAALDQLKQTRHYDSLQDALRQARFSVIQADHTPMGRPAWHAPNPAAGYDAYVTESGVSIAVNDKTFVSLHLHSLGYGSALQFAGLGEVSGEKQMIRLQRAGVQEWFVNGPDGLEHGFTLNEPPGERVPGEPLRLALQVSQGWQAVASEDSQRITLRGAETALEYSKLVVRDSQGHNIPARLTVADEQVVIEVEDGAAAYPLTIDPVFTFQQKLVAWDGASLDRFGSAVALSGNTVAIGAPENDIGASQDQGSVYIFVRNGTTWSFQQKLTANDGTHDLLFGGAVALSGDTLAVSAATRGYQAGSVYIFTRSGTTWTQQPKLTAYDGAPGNLFGYALALSDTTLVVGAYGTKIGANNAQGAVYVFTRTGATWSFQQKLWASDGAAEDFFGFAVALSGETLAVGARNATIGTNAKQGSAYVFVRYGTVWSFHKKFLAFDGAAEDRFGTAVALSGNTLAVGAFTDDISVNKDQGSVYVYVRSGNTWAFQQKLTANDGAQYDHFGNAVALVGELLVVGAFEDDIGTNSKQGSVYAFTRSGTAWTQQPKLTASDGTAPDRFGIAVALSPDTLVVGASGHKINLNAAQGTAYVFAYPPTPCPLLTLAPPSLPNGELGVGYQQFLLVTGGTGPFEFTLLGGALPPGLTLTAIGLVAGTPTALGAYSFTVRATSLSSLCSTTRTYTVTVKEPCSALIIEPDMLPDGVVGKEYLEKLTATGGKEPYTFSANGTEPPGLSLTPDGYLKGTPTTGGSFGLRVTVRDERGCYGGRSYTLTIKDGRSAVSRGKR